MAIVNVNEIKSINWSPQLGTFGAIVENIEDIEQCISNILLTPRGSDPHRPEFATGIFDYIDYPQSSVKPLLIKEAYESIITWEPRVNILNINVDFLADEFSRVEIQIEWQIKNSSLSQVTAVRI